MRQLVIEPRDTLLFRDAREFGIEAGGAKSRAFPLPSVLAGAVRTRLGGQEGVDFRDDARIRELLTLPVLSPFLVRLADVSTVKDWYFPAPADAVAFEGDEILPLYPHTPPPGSRSDFEPLGLLPLSFEREMRKKPAANPCPFWSYQRSIQGGLAEPRPLRGSPGISGPCRESRIHLKVGLAGTAEERHLFCTEMLRFTQPGPDGKLSGCSRLGLAALIDRPGLSLDGLYPLGGERRLGHWHSQEPSCPGTPAEVRAAIRKSRRARLLLITPGYFERGVWKPEHCGEGVRLDAAAIRGPLAASGWDLRARRPKPSRRLAPAGSVYFVSLPKDWSDHRVDQWIEEHWFRSIADDEQSRNDGFAVALVGAWTHEIRPLGKGER